MRVSYLPSLTIIHLINKERYDVVYDFQGLCMPVGKGKVQIAVTMPEEQRDLLKEYAESHHWSMSQAASLLVAEGLEKWLEEESPKTITRKKPK